MLCRFLGIFCIDKHVCKYEFTLGCTVSLDTFFNMTKKWSTTCFYIGLKINKALFLGTIFQQSFDGFQPKLIGSELLIWSMYWTVFEYSSTIFFLSSTQQQILTESLWFSIGLQNFFPFLLVHKFHKLSYYWDESLATTQSTNQNHLTCYVDILNFLCWCYCFDNTNFRKLLVCSTLVKIPNSQIFSKLLTNLNRKRERSLLLSLVKS